MHRIIRKGVTYDFEVAALVERHNGSAAAPFCRQRPWSGGDDAGWLMSVLVLEEGRAGWRAMTEKTLAIVFSTIRRELSLVTIIGEDLCETC